MAKQPKAKDYTHSVWSGEKYSRPQTQDELTAESKAVLRRHPTIGRMKPMTSDELFALCAGRKS